MANKFSYNGDQDEAFFGKDTRLWTNGRIPLCSLWLVAVVAAGSRGGAAAGVQPDGRYSHAEPPIYTTGDGGAPTYGHKHASTRSHENSGSVCHVDGRAHAWAYCYAQADSHARSICRFDD